MKISLLMPTRERLARAQVFLESVVETADDLKQIEVIVTIDDDDKVSRALASPHPDLQLVQVIGPQDTMGALNTRCLEKATGDIMMLVNDDILIRSKGWDTFLIEGASRFPDGIFLMHTRDGHKDCSFPLFPILSKRGCKLLQDPYPKAYCGDCIDSHLFDIFLRLQDLGHNRIIYLPDVFFEHMHFSIGKAPVDSLYEKRSRTRGNQTFYSLWKQREDTARHLAQIIQGQASSLALARFSHTISSKDEQNGVSDLFSIGRRHCQNDKESPIEGKDDTTDCADLPRECEKCGLDPICRKNSYYLLLRSFFQSRQSLPFRLKYLIYHFLRETYIRFHLEKVKAYMKKS